MRFPVSRLRPLQAKLIVGGLGKPSLKVSFAPFSFTSTIDGSSELLEFDTTLEADFINLPTTEIPRLQGRSFDFPTNPTDGYIDASIYFYNVHNPVDITNLSFGEFDDGQVSLTLVTKWIMTYEATGFEDFGLTFSVPLN